MNCPYCGNEMESGYVQSRDGIIYTAKEKTSPFPSWFIGKNDIRLTHGLTAPTTCCAQRCSTCRKVIIEYSEKQ